MSDQVSRLQTPWEETDEEVQRRLRQAQATQTNWIGTIVGLVLASTALIFLLVQH